MRKDARARPPVERRGKTEVSIVRSGSEGGLSYPVLKEGSKRLQSNPAHPTEGAQGPSQRKRETKNPSSTRKRRGLGYQELNWLGSRQRGGGESPLKKKQRRSAERGEKTPTPIHLPHTNVKGLLHVAWAGTLKRGSFKLWVKAKGSTAHPKPKQKRTGWRSGSEGASRPTASTLES